MTVLDLSTTTLEVDELNIAEAAWQLDRCSTDGARSRWAAAWGRWLIKAAREAVDNADLAAEDARADIDRLEREVSDGEAALVEADKELDKISKAAWAVVERVDQAATDTDLPGGLTEAIKALEALL